MLSRRRSIWAANEKCVPQRDVLLHPQARFFAALSMTKGPRVTEHCPPAELPTSAINRAKGNHEVLPSIHLAKKTVSTAATSAQTIAVKPILIPIFPLFHPTAAKIDHAMPMTIGTKKVRPTANSLTLLCHSHGIRNPTSPMAKTKTTGETARPTNAARTVNHVFSTFFIWHPLGHGTAPRRERPASLRPAGRGGARRSRAGFRPCPSQSPRRSA